MKYDQDIRYPLLEVNTGAIADNSKILCGKFRQLGISVAGVIKGADGAIPFAKAYLDGGCTQLASSRVIHLKELKEAFPDVPMLLLRIPMICEAEDVVRYADYSLNSEPDTVKALSEAAAKQEKTHKVILMLDIGDRREGVVSARELCDLAAACEALPGISVAGVGTNYGCMSGVLPTDENLQMLADAAADVEKRLGKKLEIVSGCSSSSFIRISQGKTYPAAINHARVGGYLANPINMRINRGVDLPGMNEDTIFLKAQVVELKEKEMTGTVGKNWKGETLQVSAAGKQKRAIIAVGAQDIGSHENLIPCEEGIALLGSSSDHVVLDVSDYKGELKVGSVLSFRLRYGGMLAAFTSRHINKIYL